MSTKRKPSPPRKKSSSSPPRKKSSSPDESKAHVDTKKRKSKHNHTNSRKRSRPNDIDESFIPLTIDDLRGLRLRFYEQQQQEQRDQQHQLHQQQQQLQQLQEQLQRRQQQEQMRALRMEHFGKKGGRKEMKKTKKNKGKKSWRKKISGGRTPTPSEISPSKMTKTQRNEKLQKTMEANMLYDEAAAYGVFVQNKRKENMQIIKKIIDVMHKNKMKVEKNQIWDMIENENNKFFTNF